MTDLNFQITTDANGNDVSQTYCGTWLDATTGDGTLNSGTSFCGTFTMDGTGGRCMGDGVCVIQVRARTCFFALFDLVHYGEPHHTRTEHLRRRRLGERVRVGVHRTSLDLKCLVGFDRSIAWKIISSVLNERTKAKVQVSSGDFDGELAKLVGGESVLAGLLAEVKAPS